MANDQEIIRRLAHRWMELAHNSVMAERRRCWTALHDLRPERPMVLFETFGLEDFVTPDELQCEDPAFRSHEHYMRACLRQVEEVGDDTVLEPFFPVSWQVQESGYGVDIVENHAQDSSGAAVGYQFTHPLITPDDLDRLLPRTWQLDAAGSQQHFEQIAEVMGDILPVRLSGAGCYYPGLTAMAYRLAGNDNLLAWTYDEPETLHRLMTYLRDDRLANYQWLQEQGLLSLNVTSGYVGSGSPGYTSALPQADYTGTARLQDLWVWAESQETTMFSPAMFEEFFLPYIAAVAAPFGLVYYGCCEGLHDRWDIIRRAIPHIRTVSISPWSDQARMAELLGREYVYCRKPQPAPMSGATPDWEVLKGDLDSTLSAAKDCNLEIVFRDVMRINGDRPRLRRWVEMARARIGGAMLECPITY